MTKDPPDQGTRTVVDGSGSATGTEEREGPTVSWYEVTLKNKAPTLILVTGTQTEGVSEDELLTDLTVPETPPRLPHSPRTICET